MDKEFMSNINEENKLIVKDDGFVEGMTVIPINDEYDIVVSVNSYEYERNGEKRINHVPQVNITKDGAIVYESEMDRDTKNGNEAIKFAYQTAKYCKENYEELINY